MYFRLKQFKEEKQKDIKIKGILIKLCYGFQKE